MKPKEKAEDLVNQFRMVLMNEDTECGNELLCTSIAIKNALITVDECIKLANLMDGGFSFDNEIEYWNKVKEELEKL